MTLRIPEIVLLTSVITLVSGAGPAMGLEPLVPGSYFAENNSSQAASTSENAAQWSASSAPLISFSDEPPLDLRTARQPLDSESYSISAYGEDTVSGIAVFTPRFSGLQGSVGYRPDALGREETAELGVNWTLDLSPATRITAASSFAVDSGDFGIGASYAQGPWELQLTYGSGEGESENEEIESLALSAGYSLGPGISFTGILGAADRTNAAEENNRANDADNDDFWVVTGFKIRF